MRPVYHIVVSMTVRDRRIQRLRIVANCGFVTWSMPLEISALKRHKLVLHYCDKKRVVAVVDTENEAIKIKEI